MTAVRPETAGHDDPVAVLVEKAVIAIAVTALVLIALPLVIPVVATRTAGQTIATRTRFWIAYPWQPAATALGILGVAILLAVELTVGITRLRTGTPADPGSLVWWQGAFVAALPWLIANLAAGLLLLPAAWTLHRRRIAELVRGRRIADVIRQTKIEQARKRAADATAARRIGVRLDAATGTITPGRGRRIATPTSAEGEAFGFVTRPTVTTLAERLADLRRVRDWTDATGRLMLLPKASAAVRALLIAESGSGKTVLMGGLILAALRYRWPVFFLDAKGDPADATRLADLARATGRSATIAERWNLFAGTADQVTAKLMRLMPPPDGANRYYLDEIRGVLQAIQDREPIRSIDDLKQRLTRPGDWVRDQYDLQLVNAVVDRGGLTAAGRVLHALMVELRPLEQLIGDTGWSYADPPADLTIAPLSPADDAQARLGDLMLLDLRGYLTNRLQAGDRSPVLVVVDEYPQLVTGTSDPGDTAGSLFETARSAGVGLILATQSTAGLSNDAIRRRRALASGAALIFGRSKDPEELVQYAGTVMQMEASGAAAGDELRSARAQHAFQIPPQDVREAADGAFWIVQGGAVAPFRALPHQTPPVLATPVDAVDEVPEPSHAVPVPAEAGSPTEES